MTGLGIEGVAKVDLIVSEWMGYVWSMVNAKT